MNSLKDFKSRSIDISSNFKILPKINKSKCKSSTNLNYIHKNEQKSLEKEEIGYELEQSLNNEKSKSVKSFNPCNQYENSKEKIFLKNFEYNQCLTTNSKNNGINKEENNNENEIFDNNKEYIIMQKSIRKDKNKKWHNLSSNNINKSSLENNFSIFNNNILKNICKTYRYNNNINNNEYIATEKFSFDEISIVSKVNSSIGKDNMNLKIEDNDSIKVSQNIKDKKNNLNNFQIIINKLNKEKLELEENLHKEYLENKELKNLNEILKQTIENYIIKSGLKDIISNTSKKLDKTPINFLSEFTRYKIENEKIKKNLLLQQILSNEIKTEIENLKKENKSLAEINKKLQFDKTEQVNGNINGNNEEYLKNLSKINQELNQNYLNLQKDFALLNQNNEDLIKNKEKIIKENEILKKEVDYFKESYLKEKDKNENDFILNRNNELIKKINNIEKNNEQLKIIIDKQKNEIENMKDIINIKNNQIIQNNNEIENYKKEYQYINELIKKKTQENLNLNKEIKNIEQIINEIFDKQIKQDIFENIKCNDNFNIEEFSYLDNTNNLEDKIKLLQKFINNIIKQINIIQQQLNEKYEKNNKSNNLNNDNNSKKDEDYYLINLSDNTKYNNEDDNLIISSYNDNDNIIKYEEDKEGKRFINNSKYLINNSFEELSIIKKRENQNSLNYDIYFSNNKENEENNFKNNKIEKVQNNINSKYIKDILKTDKNKVMNSINNTISSKRNKTIIKSFSTKQIKNNNSNYSDIFKNKNIRNKKEKYNLDIFSNRKNFEEKKTDTRITTKDIKIALFNNREEYSNDYNDNAITSPFKVQDNFSPVKKKTRPNINYTNNSNYLNEFLTKNTKYSLGSQTIDSSSRVFNSNFISINNECSFKNKEKIKEIKRINSQINIIKKYKTMKNSFKVNKSFKNINNKNNLVDEVLKPTFLKSDVNSTLFNFHSGNPKSNNRLSNDILYKKLNCLK